MAPRPTGDRGSWRRQRSLQELLEAAKRVLQQVENGLEPLLTASDLVNAARAAREHGQQLRLRQGLPELWANPNQDTAAYLALFFLALRRSTPSYEGPDLSYTSIRDSFLKHLDLYPELTGPVLWGSVCQQLLGPALHQTDALQCYSRLLAQAADQLRPAAAAALPAATPEAAAFRPPAAGPHADAVAAGAGATSSGRAGQGAQQVSPPKPPSLTDLEPLLHNVLQVVPIILIGLMFSTTNKCAAGPRPAGHPDVSTARAQLHSSWVLEHWAQVLLLGAAAATGSGRSRERLAAQGKQAEAFSSLCHVLGLASHLAFADAMRRPCGCALAATHMAQLCAALDGGDAFGAAKPEVLVMPAYGSNEQRHTAFADSSAVLHDAALAESGCAVSVHSAVMILEGWATLLAERLADGPHAVAGVAAAGRAATEEAHASGSAGAGGAGQGGGSASGSGGGTSTPEVGQGTPEGYTAAAGATLCKLPPFNRTATFHLCLRLAKGVLACWGRPLQGVMLSTCVRDPNRVTPVLPKVSGAAMLQQALACARLALLPAVWGRERVPRRTRAQLRAWWETCVAAAQHPEALLVALPEILEHPGWALVKPPGLAMWPSADASGAIEAGLIPCVIKRMGAACNAGAVWCPPDGFAGVKPCWRDVYQLGPLGQVGELVSAVGRRLPLAVEELRALTAAIDCGRDRRRSGRAVRVLCEAMALADSCLSNLLARPVYASDSAGSTEVEAEAAGSTGSAGSAAAAATARQQLALRSSFALAELLPPLAHGVQLCAGLLPLTRRVERQAQEAAEGSDVVMLGEDLRNLISGSYVCASTALGCCLAVMAWRCGRPTGDRELGDGGSSGGGGNGGGSNDGGGCGAASGSGGGGSGSGNANGGSTGCGCGGGGGGCGGGSCDEGGGAPGVVDPSWRQLLLRDVRLMELLGAGVVLQREEEVQKVQRGEAPTWSEVRGPLAHALTLAAATFPEELRAAVGGCAGNGAAEGATRGRVAGAAGLAGDAGSPGSSCGARPCISLSAVRAVMGNKGSYATDYSTKLELVAGVLGDAGMRVGAQRGLSDLAREFRRSVEEESGMAVYIGMLMPPGEARGAMAAATTAARAPASD